jgi:site-specific recombinase XerD
LQRAYRRDAKRFFDFVGLPLHQVGLAELQAFANTLDGMALATQARTLAAVNSLLRFGHATGYLVVDVNRPLHLPKAKHTVAENIVGDADALLLIRRAAGRRNS